MPDVIWGGVALYRPRADQTSILRCYKWIYQPIMYVRSQSIILSSLLAGISTEVCTCCSHLNGYSNLKKASVLKVKCNNHIGSLVKKLPWSTKTFPCHTYKANCIQFHIYYLYKSKNKWNSKHSSKSANSNPAMIATKISNITCMTAQLETVREYINIYVY